MSSALKKHHLNLGKKFLTILSLAMLYGTNHWKLTMGKKMMIQGSTRRNSIKNKLIEDTGFSAFFLDGVKDYHRGDFKYVLRLLRKFFMLDYDFV